MCWYAAQGGNRDLSLYYLRRVRALLRRLTGFKPKYRDQVEEFDRQHLEPTYQALTAGDVTGFEREYRRAVDRANDYHVETGHPYIAWSLPDRAPLSGLELGPGSSAPNE